MGSAPTGSGESGVGLPGATFAASAHPNPFNPITKIEFNLPKEGHLSLKIFNIRGELVRTLINEIQPQGEGHMMWDGANDQGQGVASGVYFYEARTAKDVQINKLALVR